MTLRTRGDRRRWNITAGCACNGRRRSPRRAAAPSASVLSQSLKCRRPAWSTAGSSRARTWKDASAAAVQAAVSRCCSAATRAPCHHRQRCCYRPSLLLRTCRPTRSAALRGQRRPGTPATPVPDQRELWRAVGIRGRLLAAAAIVVQMGSLTRQHHGMVRWCRSVLGQPQDSYRHCATAGHQSQATF